MTISPYYSAYHSGGKTLPKWVIKNRGLTLVVYFARMLSFPLSITGINEFVTFRNGFSMRQKTVRANIKDVASVAGVSTQTVSRVINERPDVSPETRKRVKEVIEQVGYRPSALARSLISGSRRHSTKR